MIFLEISTDGTAKHLLLSVTCMIASHWTCSWTWALWQLIFGVFANVVSVTLALMARFTKMSVTPAKPLCNTAAKLALEFDKVLSVLGTVLYWNITAARTYKLLWVECSSRILCLIHCCNTVFSASEIRLLTFKAHKVCVYNARILFRLTKVRRILVFQFLV